MAAILALMHGTAARAGAGGPAICAEAPSGRLLVCELDMSIGGGEAEVAMARAAGLEAAGPQMTDDVYLPDVHPVVVEAIDGNDCNQGGHVVVGGAAILVGLARRRRGPIATG